MLLYVVVAIVVGGVINLGIVDIVAAWGLVLAHLNSVLMRVLGPVRASGREVLGPVFRDQALNALLDFAVSLV